MDEDWLPTQELFHKGALESHDYNYVAVFHLTEWLSEGVFMGDIL